MIGPNAAEAQVTGGGSAQINSHYKITPLMGVLEAFSVKGRVRYAPGCGNNRLTNAYKGEVAVEFFQGRLCQGAPAHTEKSDSGEFLWFDLPARELVSTDFSVRLTATFVPEESGEHLVGMTNAGLAKLYVDGVLAVNGYDDWSPGENYFGTANKEQRQRLMLKAGRSYQIVVEYASPTTKAAGVTLTGVRFGVEKPLGDRAIDEAVEVARSADVALLLVGRNGEWDTEGLDLPDMRLPGRQEELIEKVAAANPNTVVVLQTGGPIEMPWLPQVRAVLQMWYPGQELGNALADVLFGDAEPGGRLPQTFPARLADNSAAIGDPSVYPGKEGHVRYEEGVFVGYRHHDTRGVEPLFPFGFGLGYTRFDWDLPRASTTEMGPEGITVLVNVTNVGERQGSEVVQLYVRPVQSKVARPDKELRAFAKLSLQPRETGVARLVVGLRDLSYFDVGLGAFVAEEGDYELLIARHAGDIHSRIKVHLAAQWSEPVRRPKTRPVEVAP